MTTAFEVNFDGIVGPTHNYGGLAYGNIASIKHRYSISNPRAAVLQGLAKMKFLANLGLKQAVLPPHERPALHIARDLGFCGSDGQILEKLAKEAPFRLASLYSSSGMWTANAGTVSPRADTSDGRTHITAANLVSQFHRSLESDFTSRILKTIFSDEQAFTHHNPLPGGSQFSDEGAANHTRLCASYGDSGIEIFTYGREEFNQSHSSPSRFPARQTLEASRAITRLHGLDHRRTIFARQNPEAIDAGVFHNDVISVGNKNVFLYHAFAFADPVTFLKDLRRKFAEYTGVQLIEIEVKPDELSLKEAVETYIFNSQIVSLLDDSMCLIAPIECLENTKTKAVLERIAVEDNSINQIQYMDVRQSMKNGGGPACLRLRVVLTEAELDLVHQGVLLTDDLYEQLVAWAEKQYRDELHLDDLVDPSLIDECYTTLDELSNILQVGSIYDFQKVVNDF